MFGIKKRPAIVTTFLIAACELLAGCADTAGINKMEAGESIVHGKVNMAHYGERIANLNRFEGGVYRVIMLGPNEIEAVEILLADDGRFAWALGPGEYSLVAIYWLKANKWGTQSTEGILPLRVRFTVPERPVAMYVGNIQVIWEKLGMSLQVKDDFEVERSWLLEHQVSAPAEPLISLARIEKLGTFSEQQYPCAARWHANCEDYQIGVKPLQPKFDRSEHVAVSSLTPTLRWSPAGSPEVKYDVVVYEAVMFRGTRPTLLPGRTVVYRQAIDKPQYDLDTPLKPDKSYLWSVRFRDGDTVSEWSTTGYSTFYLLGSSVQTGKLFAFRTSPSAE